MGMPDAFGPKANFSGMDGTQNLYISDVFHKAWVEVNEEGTEAAAATAVTMGIRGMPMNPPPPPPVFRADHPFIFFIRGHPFRQPAVPGQTRGPNPLMAATSA